MSQRLSKDQCSICLEEKIHPLFFSNCSHSICNYCIELITKDKKFIDCPECRKISKICFQRVTNRKKKKSIILLCLKD